MARFTEQLRQILHFYARAGATDVSQTDIADALSRNRATIHAHCARLVDLKYLTRLDYGRYEITAAGRSALERRAGSAAKFVKCPDCGRKIFL